MVRVEHLKKLKNHRNTFVIHSDNPYAAVAAMGQMSGRAQAAGPYFHLRTSVATEETSVAPEAPPAQIEGRSTDIRLDFKRDFIDFMKEYAQSVKVKFAPSGSFADMTVRHLNTVRRLPAARSRAVREARGLAIPGDLRPDYEALKEIISSGVNLRPYLARNLQDPNNVLRSDKLLNAWGIHHLHLQPSGSGFVLLCKITDDAVFLIQLADHIGPQSRELWVDPELLRIVHVNWPEELADYRLNLASATPQVADRIVVRENNVNFTATMPDGTTYFSHLTTSGHCIDDRDNCHRIVSELDQFERFVQVNANEFRTGLRWPDAEPVTILMKFDGRDCCFYEPTTQTAIQPSQSPV
jgi:hypothetical protein